MISLLVESAVRAMIVALVVAAGLRLLRVRNVPAQKAAWGLVLACAVAMPMLMRWQLLPDGWTFHLPATLLPASSPSAVFPSASSGRVVLTTTTASGVAVLSLDDPGIAAPSALRRIETPRRQPTLMGTGSGRFPAPVITSGRADSSDATLDEANKDAPAEIQLSAPNSSHSSTGWWAAAVAKLPKAATLALLVYATVCLLLLGRMAFGLSLALKLWNDAEPFVPMPSPTGQTDPTLGLRVRFSSGVASPVTIGSGVLLPAECLLWDEEKLRVVLAHERAHVEQRDFYLQLGATIYAAAFWFSPLGWWLKRTLCDLSEAISDHAGLEEAASHASYAQVLLEFAALPRPTAIGVAMARSNNLSQRIERLLNESSFRQAFAGSRSRIIIAILLVPAALCAGTSLIRVQAAQQVQAPAAPVPPAAPASEPASPVQDPPAVPAPAPAPAADAIPAPPEVAPPPAAPAAYGEVQDAADARAEAARALAVANEQKRAYSGSAALYDVDRANVQYAKALTLYRNQAERYAMLQSSGHGNSYSYSSNGDSWAFVTEPGEKINFNGDWNDNTHADIDKARKLAHGKFLWFKHDGKTYVVDDPAIVGELQALYKPIEDLGVKQEALGKQQEELGKQQEELGRKQEQATIPTPDISKEMAELNEAVASLNAKKGGTITQDQLSALQDKIGEIEGRIGDLQGKMGEKQGQFGELQGKLGEEQGKLGEQEGILGEQQGKLSEQADRKVKAVINETIHSGKARPVE